MIVRESVLQDMNEVFVEIFDSWSRAPVLGLRAQVV